MSACTATLRYPGYMNNDLLSIISPLIPTNKLHFLMTGYTPLTVDQNESSVRKVFFRCITQLSKTDSRQPCWMWCVVYFNQRTWWWIPEIENQNLTTVTSRLWISSKARSILPKFTRGESLQPEIYFALFFSLQRIRERKLANFIPWSPASLRVVLTRKSPYVESKNRVSGLMLANHTSVST